MGDELDGPTTRGTQLARAERILAAAGSPAPWAEAAELLAHALGVPLPLLLAQLTSHMDQANLRTFAAWITRRAAGEALPLITGHLEIMGLDIAIGHDGTLASPGAQRVVETALQWARSRPLCELLAVEVCTGCGAIALALAALEPRFTHIYAVDSSPSALEAARANGARYLLNLVISWLEGEGLDVVPEPVDLIVCGQPSWTDLEHVPAKLRRGGALICAVDNLHRPMVADLVQRRFLSMPAWIEAQDDAPAIVLAQLCPDREVG